MRSLILEKNVKGQMGQVETAGNIPDKEFLQ